MCWLLWAVFEIVHIMRCATVTQLWFSRLESWSRDVSSRDSFFKILVLVFWLFILQFCHKISDSELRWTFVGRSLDIKPCLPIFVVCWLLNRWSTSYILISRSFSWLTSLYYVSNDFLNLSVMELCFSFLDLWVSVLELEILFLVLVLNI